MNDALKRQLEQIKAMRPMWESQNRRAQAHQKFLAEYAGCTGPHAAIEAEKKFLAKVIRGE